MATVGRDGWGDKQCDLTAFKISQAFLKAHSQGSSPTRLARPANYPLRMRSSGKSGGWWMGVLRHEGMYRKEREASGSQPRSALAYTLTTRFAFHLSLS